MVGDKFLCCAGKEQVIEQNASTEGGERGGETDEDLVPKGAAEPGP